MAREKLWRYSGVTRMWGWGLLVAAVLLALAATGLEASAPGGLGTSWLVVAGAVTAVTGVIMYPLSRVWLMLPSSRLHLAAPTAGPRRLEAGPGDWRRWQAITVVILVVGGLALIVFLVAILGRGGTAEGVVVGICAAWGATTLRDARRIEDLQEREGRQYYASGPRPTGVAHNLVWIPAGPP